jgi:hypothetical protein
VTSSLMPCVKGYVLEVRACLVSTQLLLGANPGAFVQICHTYGGCE